MAPLVTNFGVFRIAGQAGYVHDDPAVVAWLIGHGQASDDVTEGFSLATGQRGPLAVLHEPKIKGVIGAQSAGALLVSFNADAYKSYGYEQGANAPVDTATTFKYTNALNYLLGGSDRRTIIGDATYTYWADKKTPLEDYVDDVFGDTPPPKSDAPQEVQEHARRVRIFLEQLRDGHADSPDVDLKSDVGFYVLGLSPNASRLSVRFWEQTTVGEFEGRLAQHLQDMNLVGARETDPPLVIRRIVEATGRAKVSGGSFQGYDTDAVSPMLAGAITRAVLTGSPYPTTLLGAILNRLRADGYISHPRVAAIKASLVPRQPNSILNQGGPRGARCHSHRSRLRHRTTVRAAGARAIRCSRRRSEFHHQRSLFQRRQRHTRWHFSAIDPAQPAPSDLARQRKAGPQGQSRQTVRRNRRQARSLFHAIQS